jgi:hypothetical protein
MEVLPIGRDDSCALLSSMLKGIEAEISQIGGFGVIIDSKDAAHEWMSFLLDSSMIYGASNRTGNTRPAGRLPLPREETSSFIIRKEKGLCQWKPKIRIPI